MNKIILVGRLTKDVEQRYTQNNICVSTFTIAVGRKPTKDGKVETDFIPCVAWDKVGEFIAKYFGKGRKIIVQGRLQTRHYEDQNGKTVYVTEVIVEEADFADSKVQEVDPAPDSLNIDDPDLPF